MTDTARASTLHYSESFKQQELFPIREVSRLTGVNPVTLRAWERRYGLIQPTRTESGHRLYSMADVEAVRRILAWTERGVAVSKVGSILSRSEASRVGRPLEQPQAVASEWSEWRAQVQQAVNRFDDNRLDQLYGQIFSTYPLAVVFQDILLPLWQQLLVCQSDFGQTSEWLFFDNFLRARVLQRLQLGRAQTDDRVVLAAMPGHCRELELLVAGLLLSCDQVAVSVLAIGQPLDELALVCEKVRPRALVLYSNAPPKMPLLRQVRKLALRLDCPLAMAGEAAEDALRGSPIACLGSASRLMQRRLLQFLDGKLDT
ncbi:MerR family transcriptional regulator [Stutzerimonas stutzeri]|uniref:MerR family transcriptional regulator n=1 Tax=Stutzerimonas TaxID=2901164 RepID=UPI001BB0C343|nr:MerR family transcriptional regulator [Stutzerimonas stutzeri]MCI0916744.1 MerR family transcriptional regulator [Stutzerimonas stutzeri]QUE73972.1 MerR family transcriptional regulator [Stutzerimonas stutzeri]